MMQFEQWVIITSAQSLFELRNGQKRRLFTQTTLCAVDTHLILKHGSTKGPHSSEHEVQLVQLLVTVRWSVSGVQQTLQQITQRGYHGDVRNGRDFLETHA